LMAASPRWSEIVVHFSKAPARYATRPF
jgi:hypothetical protein